MEDKLSPEEERELAELESLESQALSSEEEAELVQLDALEHEESTSASEAALRGAAQGISLGFSDEIQSGIESAFSDKTYAQALEENRAIMETAKQEHPVAFTGGEIGGGLLIPGLGTAGAAKSGITLAKAGVAAGKIAAVGAIDGLGKSTEDDLESQFSDALYGGAGALAGAGIMKGGGKLAGKAGRVIQEEAQGMAERSMGIFNASSRKAFRKNLEVKGISPEQFTERVFSQKDVNGKQLLSGMKSQQELLDGSRARMSQLGEEMGAIVKRVEAETGEVKVSNKEMSAYITGKLSEKYKNDPTLLNQAKEADAVLKRFAIKADLPDENLSNLIYWKNDLLQDFSKNVDRPFFKASDVERDAIREISNYVELKVSAASNDGALIDQFRKAKADFGTLAEYGKHVQKSVDMDEKGMLGKIAKSLSWAPLAMATGGGVGGVGGAMTGLVLGTALKTAAKNPTALRGASKAAMAVGKHLEKGANPEFAMRLSNAATRSMDDFLAELDVLNMKTQGFITDPGEAEQLTQRVKGSGVPTREKMRQMSEINNGRVPTPPSAESAAPFMKVYKQRDRRQGRKKSDL